MNNTITSTFIDDFIETSDTISETSSNIDDIDEDVDFEDENCDYINIIIDDRNNPLFYNVSFDYNTQYIFVNHMLALMYGHLPSFCYYTLNDGLHQQFWNQLTLIEYARIYNYLYHNGFIAYDEFINIESSTIQELFHMRNRVNTFIDTYFIV
jgi:hypothetical protein